MSAGHNHHHFHRPDGAEAHVPLMRWGSMAAVAVAITLVVIKTVAWQRTGSLSILSSGVDSLLDVVASTVNFFAIRYALMPPDSGHRFGHGKAEDIAGLAQAAFIAGSGLFIFVEGVGRLLNPPPILQENTGLWVMGISVTLTILLVLFQRYVVRKTGSIAVGADSFHYVTDILSNLGVIVALVLSAQFGWNIADPLIAFAIAAYILHGAWQIGFTAFHRLMDHEFPEAERQNIITLVKNHSGVLSLHELKTRQSGMHRFIQMHLGLDETLTLKEAHSITEAVEEMLMHEYPMCDVLIHQDPVAVKQGG